MKTSKVLLVVRHPVGGIRTFFRYVYRRLGSERYQFTLIAPDVPEVRVLLDDLIDLNLRYIPIQEQAGASQLFKATTKALRSERFDLVHSHGFTSGVCSIVGSLLSRTPHLLTCHDVFIQEQFLGLKGNLKRLVLGLLLSTVDRIHCVSQDARANLLEYLPILNLSSRRIIAIQNGIEVGEFLNASARDLRRELGLSPDSFLIGFLGRFMSQKGFKYLVEAVAALENEKTGHNVVLLCFGHDGFIKEEQADVVRKGLENRILFLPFVPDVASTLKGLDVVAMPSLWEACGLLAMEALVSGVPLIGSGCIGLREVLSNTPARMVASKDGQALSDALLAEITSPSKERARAFSLNAAERFKVDKQATEIEDLMLQLLKQ
jgi:glycosyltransferase involved in cell wall biosynthesis